MCWIHFVSPEPVSDFGWYFHRAVDISQGKGYSSGGTPTGYWPVGYSAFLGALFFIFGPSLYVGKMANVILYMGILFLAYRLARRLFKSEITGRTTLAILSFYPNHIAYCSLLASEILFLFLLLCAVNLLVVETPRVSKAILSGIIFGLGCLVKPQSVFLPAIFFGATLTKRIREKTFRETLVFFLIAYALLALTLLPWEIRNYRRFEHFVFVTTYGGINLFIGNNPYATGSYTVNEKMEEMLKGARNEYERDRKAGALALEYIKQHPSGIVKLLPRKLYYLYYKDVEGIDWNERGIESTQTRSIMFFERFKILAQGYYMFIMTASLLGILVFLGKKSYRARFPASSTVGLSVISYFTIVGLVFFGHARFHFPIVPWVTMYLGALVDTSLTSR
jgi:4-amino-4-deoxy-L-arabinose transferase-like glycosyltransferase